MESGGDGILIRAVAIGDLGNKLFVNLAESRVVRSVGFMTLGLRRSRGC